MVSISIFFAFSLIGIIIGGIATLVTLMFAILSLVAGKNENAAYWAISFVISISVVVFSVVQIVERVENKVKSGIEWVKQEENNIVTTKEDSFDHSKTERKKLIDSLKTLVSLRYETSVTADFYSAFSKQIQDGENDTLPFIYPYAFEYKNYNFNLINIVQPDLPMIDHISQLAYDSHFLLLKIDRTNTELNNNEPEISYFLIDLKTGKQTQFLNSKKLQKVASENGYKGNTDMIYISDLYQAWFTNNYD